ncbi:MAG: DUF3006 family protein [Gemmatimonadota bacterium]
MTDADEGIVVVVDRHEADQIVLMADDGRTFDVPAVVLPSACRKEGAVIRLRMKDDGTPDWDTAVRDRLEERRRREDLTKRVSKLGRPDSGGDVVL